MNNLSLRPGSLADYRALAGFHYLSHAPVTAGRVLVIEDRSPSILQRWHAMQLARDKACEEPEDSASRIIALLIESLPALSCAMREAALPGRYAGMDRRSAARLLNDEVRCISRVVVHPQYRGLGLAVRLVRHALDTATTPYIEALAAMGRVHPFFKLAGMTEYQRPPHAKDQRLLDTMRSVGIAPWELASPSRLNQRLNLARTDEVNRRLTIINPSPETVDSSSLLCPADAMLFRRALGRWAGRSLSFDEQLDLARRKLLTEPRYYLHARSVPSPAAQPCSPILLQL